MFLVILVFWLLATRHAALYYSLIAYRLSLIAKLLALYTQVPSVERGARRLLLRRRPRRRLRRHDVCRLCLHRREGRAARLHALAHVRVVDGLDERQLQRPRAWSSTGRSTAAATASTKHQRCCCRRRRRR